MIRNKVTITKVDYSQLEAIHFELEMYAKNISPDDLRKDFLNAIMTLDIAHSLFFFLRNKLETDKTQYTISFSASQAAVLLKCCYWTRVQRSPYTANVMLKLSLLLDEQLKAMV
ncbi:hypothetical protein [Flavobacterium commune]|uniref:Uncharacterized protein n=1 Tax=Flavobacterium commune TaxID=1306519 RepID=A0A1D9PAI2_9FLAO|nr:hypothetical protein [Flavobacterium commune]AOZ99610.1 hypothetical protein BIW12_09240 [Flavobacterium commune]